MNRDDARIGVSLLPVYLPGRRSAIERDLYGEPDGFLAELARHGVGWIELRSLP